MQLTDDELIYLWDALNALTDAQANGCSNIAGGAMCVDLMRKLTVEMEVRGLA